MTNWINIPKKTGTSWNNVTKATGSWSNVSKAVGTGWIGVSKPVDITGGGGTLTVGSPIGLLLALTYATGGSTPGTSRWVNVSKAPSRVWTNIPKA